jgi:hypothetical protein
LIGDCALSGSGNVVPSSERTLLKADFSATGDARGVFAVVAAPDQGGCFWASGDRNDSTEEMRDFAGIPFRGGPGIFIGQITVGIPIPEPSGLRLLLAGIASLSIGCRVCRSHRRQR